MAGQLTNHNLQRLPDEPRGRPFKERLNHWSTRPGGLLTLQMAGMAAALALGYGIAKRPSVVYGMTNPAPIVQNSGTLSSDLEAQRRQIELLTAQNAVLTRQRESLDTLSEDRGSRLKLAATENEKLRKQNEELKRAAELLRGSRIVLPRTPAPLPVRVPKATVVAINRGQKEGVASDGQGGFLVVRRPSPSVTEALRSGLKKPPLVAQMAPANAVKGGAIELQSPLATALRPGPVTLRWRKAAGATGYSVQLLDEKGADVLGKEGEMISASETPFGAEWTVPRALGPGTYHWQVTAHMPGGTAVKKLTAAGRPAMFTILDAGKTAEIRRAESQFAGNGLELGVRYAKLGMLDDAEAALIPFVAAYPDSPQLKRLLEQVRGWRAFRTAG